MDHEWNQKSHFNNIANLYDSHYGDDQSKSYREQVIFPKLFQGISFHDKKVLDAMSGGGYCTSYMLQKGVRECFGLDISENLVEYYNKRYSEASGVVGSVTNIPFKDNTFDVVCVHGGIHHVHPNVNEAILEIIRVTKTDGYICLFEPPSNTLIDMARKIWYKFDKYFEMNESSIDFEKINNKHSSLIQKVSGSYGGGLGYFLVFNSLITRMPKWLKRILAPFLIKMDILLDPLIPHFLSSYEIVIYQKK